VVDKVKYRVTQLEKEKRQALAILNSMSERVIAVDKECRIVSLNPAVEKIFQVSNEQAKGRFFLETVPNNDLYGIISRVILEYEILMKLRTAKSGAVS